MKKMTFIALILVMIFSMILITGCSDAAVASQNLSTAADQFKIERRIIFYNGITGEYILVIEGFCSLAVDTDGDLNVTCKTGENSYKKHFLGLSDNVTYFAEQIDSVSVDTYHYQVIFKPSVIIPDVIVP